MAQPSAYNRAFNFSNYQAQNPTSPLPGAQVDIELSRLKAVTDEIRAVIAAIQRDDLALSNRSVGYDQLKPELDGFGFNPPRAWVTATNYVVRDTAFADSGFYQCLVSHTSGTFSTDLAAGKWELIADFSEISAVTDASYLASGTLPDARLSFTVTDFAKTILDDADAATVRATIGVEIGADVPAYDDRLIPFAAGMVMPFAGASAPTGWLLCYGQAVSRTTYAALFSALGTTWGAGNGSTTFNLPDLRGRVLAGKDNMGGTSADRLTNQSGGLNGDTLGATGGAETHVLTEGQLAAHTHAAGTIATASDGAHVHSIDFTGVTSHDTSGGGKVASGGSSTETINAFNTQSSGAHTHTITGSTASTGSGTAHNNVQPTAVVNFIIKT